MEPRDWDGAGAALAMILGVTIGTYSSGFIASPVVILLGKGMKVKK